MRHRCLNWRTIRTILLATLGILGGADPRRAAGPDRVGMPGPQVPIVSTVPGRPSTLGSGSMGKRLPKATAHANPQTPNPPRTAGFTAAALRRHVFALADDRLGGRGAGYAGERQAAEYIAQHFREAGLEAAGDADGATFFQVFSFHPKHPPNPWQVLEARNVVGFWPGTDLAQEIIILGAHFDGQGQLGEADAGRLLPEDSPPHGADRIWNSADDNASSVAVLLEVARNLGRGERRPRRSIVLVAFSAEEHALNGSAFFAAHPPFAWPRFKAMINLEKLGRAEAPLMTATTGTSTAFSRAIARAKACSELEASSFYGGIITDTDHYPFAARKLPAMVLGTGNDRHIHLPSDSAEKLDYQFLAERAHYLYCLLMALAEIEDPFAFTGNLEGFTGVLTLPPTEAELRVKHASGRPAVKVSAVLKGLPGERAGFQPGDLVLAIEGKDLDAPHTGSGGELGEWITWPQDGSGVAVRIQRGDARLTLTLR